MRALHDHPGRRPADRGALRRARGGGGAASPRALQRLPDRAGAGDCGSRGRRAGRSGRSAGASCRPGRARSAAATSRSTRAPRRCSPARRSRAWPPAPSAAAWWWPTAGTSGCARSARAAPGCRSATRSTAAGCSPSPACGTSAAWAERRWRRRCVLTTAANDICAPVHDRMPCVLASPEAEAAWLFADLDAEAAAELLVPLDAARTDGRAGQPGRQPGRRRGAGAARAAGRARRAGAAQAGLTRRAAAARPSSRRPAPAQPRSAGRGAPRRVTDGLPVAGRGASPISGPRRPPGSRRAPRQRSRSLLMSMMRMRVVSEPSRPCWRISSEPT